MLFSFLYSCEDEGSVLRGYSRKYKYKYQNLPYVLQFVLVFISRS